MRIYFIRHGEAESSYENDFTRNLTTAGRIKLHKIFAAFAKSFSKLEDYKIYSSPLNRAKQTAEILSEYLKKDFGIKEYLATGPLNQILDDFEPNSNYILVGHEPLISNWIRELTNENVIVSRGSIHLVELDLEKRKGRLLKITI